jgi:hypothetical protein
MTIRLGDLLAITDFLQRGSEASSARSIDDWCNAREIDPADVVRYAETITRCCLETVALEERETKRTASPAAVESAIAAAIVTGLQVGVDAERRRRDARELPS